MEHSVPVEPMLIRLLWGVSRRVPIVAILEILPPTCVLISVRLHLIITRKVDTVRLVAREASLLTGRLIVHA